MTHFPSIYLFLAQGRIVGLWALLILERTLVHGRDLLVRLHFCAIYYLGGMVLAFASLFYDFVVDCIFHSHTHTKTQKHAYKHKNKQTHTNIHSNKHKQTHAQTHTQENVVEYRRTVKRSLSCQFDIFKLEHPHINFSIYDNFLINRATDWWLGSTESS